MEFGMHGTYLRPEVIAEPLVNYWYAWTYLVAPAAAAMLVGNHQMRVLDSFLRQPELHRRAVSESAMRGGMVIDHTGDLGPVSDLLERTRAGCKAQIAFCQAVRELGQILATRIEPLSMADLYARVPPILKGVVELSYDLQHRPGFRFIEKLLYEPPLYDESLQSIAFFRGDEEQRPFVLSTPRFDQPERARLATPFRSVELGEILTSRHRPLTHRAREYLHESLVTDTPEQALRDLFTAEPPPVPADREFDSRGVRVRYFGHATVLVQSAHVSILLDPVVSYARRAERPHRYTLQDLPGRIDYVLLTHCHQDHVCLETLLQLRDRIGMIVVPRCASGNLQDPSLRLMLEAVGFEHVIELDELGTLPVCGGRIIGIPFLGEHADLDVRAKLAYAVRLENRGMMFLADSNGLEPSLYTRIARHVGNLDALYIGMECDGAPLSWLYGPLFSRPIQRNVDQSRRLNSSDATQAYHIVEALNPERVLVYAMGLEPWLGHISSIAYTAQSRPILESNLLVQRCRDAGRPAQKLFLRHELRL